MANNVNVAGLLEVRYGRIIFEVDLFLFKFIAANFFSTDLVSICKSITFPGSRYSKFVYIRFYLRRKAL